MNQSTFLEKFARWFQPAEFTHLAREVGWLVRQGKIDAFEFFVGLVFGQMSALKLTLTAQAGCYSEPVSRQAVDQRYHQGSVDFFHRGFDQCLQRSLEQTPQPSLTQHLAAHFDAVHLVDSTSFDCPESLTQIYPGCGGQASSANCKILLRYEYLRGQFQPLALLPGKRSDSGLAEKLPPLLKANELLLNDKGFFKIQTLEQIDQKKAFFLTPVHRSVNLWVPNEQGVPVKLDLADALRQADQNVVEWPKVFLGSEAGPVSFRVMAFRLSEASAARHRAAVRRSHVTKGRTPSVAALELAGWLILITNAPAEKLPAKAMAYLYRVRWQIELIFKQCKSVLRLDVTEAHQNEYRVQCEIWARLISAVVLFAWHSHLQVACSAKQGREISFGQVARALQQQGLITAQLLIKQGQTLCNGLRRLWRHLLKTTVKGRQRSRKTTWEALVENWLQFDH
jgi:hypothetical protein